MMTPLKKYETIIGSLVWSMRRLNETKASLRTWFFSFYALETRPPNFTILKMLEMFLKIEKNTQWSDVDINM